MPRKSIARVPDTTLIVTGLWLFREPSRRRASSIWARRKKVWRRNGFRQPKRPTAKRCSALEGGQVYCFSLLFWPFRTADSGLGRQAPAPFQAWWRRQSHGKILLRPFPIPLTHTNSTGVTLTGNIPVEQATLKMCVFESRGQSLPKKACCADRILCSLTSRMICLISCDFCGSCEPSSGRTK